MKETCPICQRNNQCGVDNPDENCWCTKMTFPSIEVQKIDVDNVCICAKCAEALAKSSKEGQ